MILEYSVENFKSIVTEETLNFKAKKISNNSSGLLPGNILPSIVVYGPNGGGKTSLLESIHLLKDILTPGLPINDFFYENIKAFKNRLHSNEPIIWNITIQSPSKTIYKYFLKINNDFEEEKLSIVDKKSKKEMLIFHKKGDSLKTCKELNIKQMNVNRIQGTMAIFFNSMFTNEYVNEFINEISKIIPFKSYALEPAQINFAGGQIFTFKVEILEKYKDKIIDILKELDINVKNIEVIRSPVANTKTIVLTKVGDYDQEYKINFLEESAGTKKIIQLLTLFITGIHDGNVFVIDELDTQLHTKLLGYIIKMFSNQSNTSSQLIFSSHDLTTMSSEYFRKDQIYFAATNEANFTNITCLHSFGSEIREKSSFYKKYLNGELGNDPFIDYGMKWM